MLGVLFFSTAIHQYVVKVHNDIPPNERLKNLVHKPHKCAWCISQTKGHNKPLIETALGFESRLPFFSLIDANLVIATSKINLREDSGSMKLIKKILQS